MRAHNVRDMSTRIRLQPFVDAVKAAGLSGASMQKKLAEIVEREDLTPHMVRRIAEEANRAVSVELTKQAHATGKDARIRFELADADALLKSEPKAKTAAPVQAYTGFESKLAAYAEAGGDPFAAPESKKESDSLRWLGNQPLDVKLAADRLEAEYRGYDHELVNLYEKTDATRKEAAADELVCTMTAAQRHKDAVQSAIEMCTAGITVPDMYRAVLATTCHTNGDDEGGRDLMRLVISGLKDRGFPNNKMGFRHQGDRNAIEALSVDDLMSLCDRAVGFDRGYANPDIADAQLTKVARAYLENTAPLAAFDGNLADEAEARMSGRPSLGAGTFLDDAFTDNEPNGKARVINGENEFIIAVKDLVGAQDRIGKLRSAQTYLAVKLEEIADARGKLREALEEQKQAMGPLAAIPALGRAAMAGLASKPVATLGHVANTVSGVGQGVAGVGGVVAGAEGIAQQAMANRGADKQRKHEQGAAGGASV
jgi:hypothetical protein